MSQQRRFPVKPKVNSSRKGSGRDKQPLNRVFTGSLVCKDTLIKQQCVVVVVFWKMKIFVVFVILVNVSQHASGVKMVNEGDESVLLLCQVSSPVPVGYLVEWRRSNPDMTVHVRRDNRDQPNDQNEAYKNRTTLYRDALQTGDLSLTLKTVSQFDEATYTCTVRKDRAIQSNSEVPLQVTTRRESALLIERNVFIVLFTLLFAAVFVGSVVLIIKRWKNSKDRTAANL